VLFEEETFKYISSFYYVKHIYNNVRIITLNIENILGIAQ